MRPFPFCAPPLGVTRERTGFDPPVSSMQWAVRTLARARLCIEPLTCVSAQGGNIQLTSLIQYLLTYVLYAQALAQADLSLQCVCRSGLSARGSHLFIYAPGPGVQFSNGSCTCQHIGHSASVGVKPAQRARHRFARTHTHLCMRTHARLRARTLSLLCIVSRHPVLAGAESAASGGSC